jgi:arsenate reductase (glutaredoxin)
MPNARVIVYQKPTCTTCRQVYNALKEAGVDFETVNYFTDPIPRATLQRLLEKLGMRPRALLRTKEESYRVLALGSGTQSDDELIALMVAHPELIQRPIVETGDRAIVARPAERLKEILE